MASYLALVNSSYGCGSWAREDDKQKAATRAAKMFKLDYKSIFKFEKKHTFKVGIYDVTDKSVLFDYRGVFESEGYETENEKPIPLLEVITIIV